MVKIKVIEESNKIKPKTNLSSSRCLQSEDDILFEFGHMTDRKGYGYKDLISKSQNNKQLLKAYTDLIQNISTETWTVLQSRSKKSVAGFETLALSEFKYQINNKFNKELPKDTKLYVFRFGTGKDDCRMICYKSTNCFRTIHVLGFDLDHSLYNHGN